MVLKDNYVAGANIAGFEKVVDAMKAQGIADSLSHLKFQKDRSCWPVFYSFNIVLYRKKSPLSGEDFRL